MLLSASTSFVRVSFSLATAPRSPAFSSGTCVCVLPCRTSRWPKRSAASRVWLKTLLSCLQRTADDAQHRDPAGKRIGDRFPDKRGVRRGIGRLDAGWFTIRGQRGEFAFSGRRDVSHDRVEQRLDADGVKARRADQRENFPRLSGRTESLCQLLLCQRAFREERFHQLLVRLGDHLDQRFARLGGAVRQRGRHLALGHLAAAVRRKRQRLHPHQIDDAGKAALFAERQLNRDDFAGAIAMERLQRPLEARAFTFQAVEDDDPRKVEEGGFGPQLLGLHLHAGDRSRHTTSAPSATRSAEPWHRSGSWRTRERR